MTRVKLHTEISDMATLQEACNACGLELVVLKGATVADIPATHITKFRPSRMPGGRRLITGRNYPEWPHWRLIGWTTGDGSSHDGYIVGNYFGPNDDVYLGPDAHGIEPLFEEER